MLGLLIKPPYIEKILSGDKTWEIRGKNTKIRGKIALIRSGSGKIVGLCDLIDCRPLSKEEILKNLDKHLIPKEKLVTKLPYKKTYAWVIKNPETLETPVNYKHPKGAIIWVKLDIKL